MNYSLCFITYKNKILMINRNKKPFMGMWNVLGGHQEENESLKECAIREIKEESGITVDNARELCKFTWNYDDDITYVFLSVLPDSFDISIYPLKIDEGIVDFKEISWILDENNFGVIDDIKVFIKDIKENNFSDYHLVYDNSKLIQVIKK